MCPGPECGRLERGLEVVDTPGRGFVADMIYAVEAAGIMKPIMIIMADLPLVTPDLIDEIVEIYDERPEPALSTHTPLRLHSRLGRRTRFTLQLPRPAHCSIGYKCIRRSKY